MGKRVIPTLTLLVFLLSLLLHPARASLFCHPAFCLTHRTTLCQQPTKRHCWEITSQTGKSFTDNVSENSRLVCSVLCGSGEGASAAKPFWLWSLHGKGRYQLGVVPRLIKHLSSFSFPAAGADGAVQGLWAGEVDWPFTAPEGNMASNLGWAMGGLCDVDQTVCCSLSLFQGGIRALGLCASHRKCVVLGNW